MRVFITGATGFIGRAVVLRLRREGHEIAAWVRSPERARTLLGDEAQLVATAGGDTALAAAVRGADAIVNLSGEPIFGRRWTPERKRALRDSRVGLTERLVRAIAAAEPRPRTLVSGSAVGYYGDRGDEVLDESSSGAGDFLGELCRDWEAAARRAELSGSRVVLLRTGVVLGRGGGALAPMLPAFRLGLGGPVGSGRQYLPWVHLLDVAEIVARALREERWRGPFNVTAPEPVRFSRFARALGAALRRPALLPVPGFVLRAIFGESATVLLGGQRAIPQRLEELGFRHAFRVVEPALRDLTSDTLLELRKLGPATPRPLEIAGSKYLAARPPSRLLRAEATLDAPLDEVFPFFSRAANLGLITPPAMRFAVQAAAPTIERGASLTHRLRVAGMPLDWRTSIECFEPGSCFVDAQQAGPYRSWWHEHHFIGIGPRTRVEDRVFYRLPGVPLGDLLARWFVEPRLREIFGYRRDALRLRFGAVDDSSEC